MAAPVDFDAGSPIELPAPLVRDLGVERFYRQRSLRSMLLAALAFYAVVMGIVAVSGYADHAISALALGILGVLGAVVLGGGVREAFVTGVRETPRGCALTPTSEHRPCAGSTSRQSKCLRLGSVAESWLRAPQSGA
jgi:hypothetical protein